MIRALALAALPALFAAKPAAAQPGRCAAMEAAASANEALAARVIAAVEVKDLAAVRAALPEARRRFAAVPAALPPAIACGGVVAVFDPHQYLRWTTKDYYGRRPKTPFPVGSRFEYRNPHYTDLAEAIARAAYLLDDRTGADAALARGLLIAPRNHKLTTERLVYWIDQGRWQEIDTLLSGFFYPHERDLTDKETATYAAIHAQARVKLGDWNGARLSLGTANTLDPGNGYAAMVRKDFEAMPVPPPPARRRGPVRRRR